MQGKDPSCCAITPVFDYFLLLGHTDCAQVLLMSLCSGIPLQAWETYRGQIPISCMSCKHPILCSISPKLFIIEFQVHNVPTPIPLSVSTFVHQCCQFLFYFPPATICLNGKHFFLPFLSLFFLALWFTVLLLIGYCFIILLPFTILSSSRVIASLHHCHDVPFPDLSLLSLTPVATFLLKICSALLYYLWAFVILQLCIFIFCT